MLLLQRAVKERWPIPAAKRVEIATRLIAIVEKTGQTILDAEGNAVEVSNERNQTAAARVLASMDALNQADDHLHDKNARLDAGKVTERVDGVTLKVAGLETKD